MYFLRSNIQSLTNYQHKYSNYYSSVFYFSRLAVLSHKEDMQLVSDIMAMVDGKQVPVEDLTFVEMCPPGLLSGHCHKTSLRWTKCGLTSLLMLFSVYSSGKYRSKKLPFLHN